MNQQRKWTLVALVSLLLSIWLISYSNNYSNWERDRDACERTAAAREDSIGRDQDLADFFFSSARFRDATGEHALADESRGYATRSQARVAHTNERIRDAGSCEKDKPNLLPDV